MSFGSRGFPTTPQNAFGVFQIIITSGDLHLKKFAFIFFLKVKGVRESENHGICVAQDINKPAAILQIATGKTLWLYDENSFYLWRFYFLQNDLNLWS